MRKRTRNFIYSLVACLCLAAGGAIEAQTEPPMITSGQPPNGALGVPYSFTFTATGQSCSAAPSFDWSATGLPNGLSIDINGDLTGTPTTPGSFTNVFVTATQTSCGGPSVTQQYTITISQPLVSSVVCNPASLGPSGVSTCTVTLTQADPAAGTTVTLASNNALLTVPASVGAAAGATTATFSAVASASIPNNQSAIVTATLSGSSQTATINLIAPELVSSVVCNPTSLGQSAVSACTVTLTQPAPAGVVTNVTLASNNTLLTVPASVTVAPGATMAPFNATASASIPSNQSATVTATFGNSFQTATISLMAPVLVSGVVCNPTSLGQSAVSSCTVTLTQMAPRGGSTVTLASNNTLLTVPVSVMVAATATTATFNATAAPSIPSNQNAIVTATLGNSSQTATINLVAPVVSGVVCNPASLGQSAVSTCTVTLTQTDPAGGTNVTLASNNTLLTVPGSVTVAAGATTARFTATAAPSIPSNQNAIVTATLGSSSQTATISLVAPLVSGVVCNPTSLGQSAVSTCTVTLTQTDPAGGTTVTLASNNTLLTIPASVTVAAGATTATFSATAAPSIPNNQNAIVTATLGSSSQTATINLVAPVVSGVVCNPASLGQSAVSTCTVTLTQTDPAGGTTVTLGSNNTLLTVPGSVTVAAGATTARFTATAAPSIPSNQNAIVTATLGSSSNTATISLVAPLVSGVVCNPTSLGQSAVSTCTVTLTQTDPAGGTTVTLASNNTLLTIPASVTVAAGATTAKFNATAAPSIPSNQSATVTATLGSSSQTATINLVAPVVSGVVCNPATLGPSTASMCTVTLTQTDPAGGTTVPLASNNTLLTVPASATVAAGATTATFTATAAVLIPSNQSAIVTASLGSSSQTATIKLTPNLMITLTPDSISTTTGGSVSASFVASGGSGPYTYSISGQPAGVTLGSGSLSGSPTQAGNFNTIVTVTDSNQTTDFASITINVLGLTTTTLPTGTTGQPYATAIVAAGGNGSYSFSATGVPPGLSLANNGYLSGTVSTAGTYPISVTLSSGGLSVTTNLNLVIANPGTLSISSASLPNGTVNVPYSQALGATGGLSPYTWSVSEASVPQGLSLSASGIVSGTPRIPGSFSFGVEATDTSGAITTATASLTIQAAPLTITTRSLPSGMIGVDYPEQLLAASGGVLPYTWALGSGSSLPSGLAFSSSGVLSGIPTVTGTFSFGVAVTDNANTNAGVTFSLIIRPSSNDLILTSSSLTFSLSSPAAGLPASQVVGIQSTVASQPLAYTLAVSPAAPWLAVANGTTTPDSVQVSLTSTALMLTPGPYQTTVSATCTSSSCNGNTQTVSVNLTVTAAPPQLQISTGLLSFATTNAALGLLSQPINLQNAGGGTLGFATISCEAPWCTVGPLVPSSPGGGAGLAGGVSAALPVTVDPSLLNPGFYRTQVDISSSGGNSSVPVTLFISANSTMTLAPAGVLFNQTAGSSPGNPNGSFLVSVNNSTAVNFSVAIVPVAGEPIPSWLVLGTPSVSASSAQPGTVSYSINPVAAGALAPGAYYGEIQVSSPNVSNSPEDFEVVLNVAPANTPVTPDAEPGGLLFITTVGGVLPPQTVTVYSGSASPLTFQTSAATTSGTGWLSVTPATGSTSATAPGVTTVSVDTSKLSAGVYRGGVSYSLSATAVRTVNVTLIVSGGASSTSSAISSNAQPRAAGCTPSVLVPAQTGLVNSFAQPAGWPTPLQIVLANDCGTPVNNGQIVATFSNGDPPLALALVNPSQGLYSGTWSPANPSSEVAINVSASAPGFPTATSQLAGAVLPNAVPLLSPNGTLHVFNSLIGGALAPGTIVAVYGQNLAAAPSPTTTIPLPTALNSSSVIIGGMQAPLYYVSPGQINAQIPFELPPGNQYQVIVSANGALTTPQPIQLSPATPGLAVLSDGTLIAQHGDGSLVTQMSPAKSGEYLVVYLAGLGQTTVPVASGAASPTNPLATPAAVPVLTINGTPYPTAFAGLTPGLVGLYQINFQVPAGLTAGDITVVVSQNGQASNQAVLPYQP